MAENERFAELWRRIEAWPVEYKQALLVLEQARAKVDDLESRLEQQRELASSAANDVTNSHSSRFLAYRRFGAPSSAAIAHAERKVERAEEDYRQARTEATARLVKGYESRGQKPPAQGTLRALAEDEPGVKAKREVLQLARDELERAEDNEQHESTQERVLPESASKPVVGSADVARLERELAKAEAQMVQARVEVKHQRAIARSLELLVQLSRVQR